MNRAYTPRKWTTAIAVLTAIFAIAGLPATTMLALAQTTDLTTSTTDSTTTTTTTTTTTDSTSTNEPAKTKTKAKVKGGEAPPPNASAPEECVSGDPLDPACF